MVRFCVVDCGRISSCQIDLSNNRITDVDLKEICDKALDRPNTEHHRNDIFSHVNLDKVRVCPAADAVMALMPSGALAHLESGNTRRNVIVKCCDELPTNIPRWRHRGKSRGASMFAPSPSVNRMTRGGFVAAFQIRSASTVNYERPPQSLPAFVQVGHRKKFPVAVHLQARILSLPTFVELSTVQQDHMAGTVCDAVMVAA